MKSLLLCVVLAVAAVAGGSVLRVSDESEFDDNQVIPFNQLLFKTVLVKRPIPGVRQSDTIEFRGNNRNRIRAINRREIGPGQNIRFNVVSGGVGQAQATIRVESDIGRGYHLEIEIWS